MPIYDNDGTTNRENLPHDNNGTTSYKHQAVYDNDGTTNRLIYLAEETLFPGVNSSVTSDYGSAGAHDNFSVTIAYNGQGTVNSFIRYVLVNLTPYSILKINCHLHATASGSPMNACAGVVIHTAMSYPYYTIGGGAAQYTRMHRVVNGGTYDSTWTTDVSALSGNHYIYVQNYNQHASTHGDANARIHSIVGELK